MILLAAIWVAFIIAGLADLVIRQSDADDAAADHENDEHPSDRRNRLAGYK